MIRLVWAELRRLGARRLVRVMLAFAAVAIVAGGVIAFTSTSALSETRYQQRARAAELQQQTQRAHIAACLRAHGVAVGDNYRDDIARACFPEQLAAAHDPRFHRDRLYSILKGTGGILAIAGWALGASFVGAEFASRSMTTLLTWEPRRTRVFVTKAVVALLAGAAFAALTLLALALALWPALALHGAPLRAGEPTIASALGLMARASALAALAAAMGFALATLGRNTAAALGVGFAYIVVLENILGNSLRQWRRWLLLGNAIVFVSGRSEARDIPGRSVAGAGFVLAAVAGALLIGAYTTFRTRDLA